MAGLVLVGTGDAAAGSYPGHNGKIAFVRGGTSGSGGDIWVVNADGTGVRRLLTNGTTPQWSPDGRKLAFTRLVGGRAYIFTAKADGTGITQLTRGGHDRGPTWSPDGTKIALSYEATDSRIEIGWTRSAPPFGAVHRVTDIGCCGIWPNWSPLGDKILYGGEYPGGGDSGHVTLNVVPVAGGAAKVVVGTDFYNNLAGRASWSPGGKSIAYEIDELGDAGYSHTLYRSRADGTARKVVRHFPAPYAFGGPPAWSPDGAMIAAVRVYNGLSSLYRIGYSGAGYRLLAKNAAYPDWQPVP